MSDQPLEEIWAEWEDLFSQARAHLAALRNTTAPHQVQQAVAALFRATHTLKGMAGMVGFTAFARAAHRMEDLFDLIRKGKLRSTDGLMDTLEGGIAALESGFNDLRRGRPEPEDYLHRLRKPLGELEALARLGNEGTVDLSHLLDLPEAQRKAFAEEERRRITVSLQDGIPIHALELGLGFETFDEVIRKATEALALQGEIISTLPVDLPDAPDQLGFLVVVAASALDLAPLALPEGALRGFRVLADGSRVPQALQAAPAGPEPAAPPAEPGGEPAPAASPLAEVELIRLPVATLSALEAEVEEAIQISDELHHWARRAGAPGADPFLDAMGARLLGLQRTLLQMRMVKVESFFNRLDPLLKSLSRELAKPVKLVFTGGDLELERALVGKLIDPFVHLIRNAFDHGLESPEERKALGKAEHGSIRISATQKGRVLRFDIRDDGRGFDLERIAAKARGLKLLRPGEEPTSEELHRLVFEPGFTTRDEAGSISGRGVGMDAVREEIERLGGEVHLSSEWKRGSLIRLTFPMAKAIAACLKVRAGSQLFGIPISSVVRVQTLAQPLRGGERVQVLGRDLTFESLQACMGRPDPPEGQRTVVVVAVQAASAASGIELALGVDAILDRGEVLLRGLPEHARLPGLMGVSFTEEGALWGLDPEELVGLGMESLVRRVTHA